MAVERWGSVMRLVSLYRCQYTKWVGPVNIGALLLLFPGRLISLRGDVEWPARSPDLSPCDVFLWGYLKERFSNIVLDVLRI